MIHRRHRSRPLWGKRTRKRPFVISRVPGTYGAVTFGVGHVAAKGLLLKEWGRMDWRRYIETVFNIEPFEGETDQEFVARIKGTHGIKDALP